MKHSPGSLSPAVHRQLNLYAIGAAAAGVSALAMSQPAKAKIIYTPANVRILPNSTIQLDLNHDGIDDFKLSAFYVLQSTGHAGTGALIIQPAKANGVWQAHSSASALPAGFRIGSANRRFGGGSLIMAAMFQTDGNLVTFGPWAHVKNRYLGLKFAIKGKTHYGWARLSVKIGFGGATGVLTGFAYESIPGKPIIAGKTKGPEDNSIEVSNASVTMPTSKPASLGMLALGSPALSIWRREEVAGPMAKT